MRTSADIKIKARIVHWSEIGKRMTQVAINQTRNCYGVQTVGKTSTTLSPFTDMNSRNGWIVIPFATVIRHFQKLKQPL